MFVFEQRKLGDDLDVTALSLNQQDFLDLATMASI